GRGAGRDRLLAPGHAGGQRLVAQPALPGGRGPDDLLGWLAVRGGDVDRADGRVRQQRRVAVVRGRRVVLLGERLSPPLVPAGDGGELVAGQLADGRRGPRGGRPAR